MPFIDYNQKRILFIHIPKTGGTSVETWLSSLAPLNFHTIGVPSVIRCTPQHMRMSDINHLFDKHYFDYIFTIVRNPYARIESEYRMRAQLQAKGMFGGASKFSLWLENALIQSGRDNWLFDNHLRPQWEFVEDNVEVFRLEDGLKNVLQQVAQRIGIKPPGKVAHKLRADESIPRVEWERTDALRVRERYARDFEAFNYSVDMADTAGSFD